MIFARCHSRDGKPSFYTHRSQVLPPIEDPEGGVIAARLAQDSHRGQIGVKREATQDDPIVPRVGESNEVVASRDVNFDGDVDILVAIAGGELPRDHRLAVQRNDEARAGPGNLRTLTTNLPGAA